MNSVTDGQLKSLVAGSGMSMASCIFRRVNLRCGLGLLSLLAAAGPSPVLADAPESSARHAMANRAMTLMDASPQVMDLAEQAEATRANQPARLDSEPILLASSMPPGDPASNAPPPKEDGDLIASIDVQSARARPITVSRNSSAVVEMKVKFDRAEIADPNVADIFVVSPTRAVVSGRNFGSTQMIIWFGDRQRVFNVVVEHDLSVLNDAISKASPLSRVTPRSVNGTILLSGTVPDAQSAERIAELASLYQGGEVRNQLSVAGVQQTMLRVVVAEVNKDAVRALGFNWAIGASDWTRDFFLANNVAQLNPTVYSSNGLANILAPNPAGQLTYSVAAVGNTANTNLTFGFPRAEFQVFMNALRQNSLSRVLAEPNLVAISGQTASFLAGGEVPIPVTQGGAVAGSITIEYKEFGVRLAFTPTVISGQIIRLHVMSEVSDAVPGMAIAGGLPVFSFTTRRVESTIECGNGQTFAIAGLLSERVQAVAEKIPGLGDLPVLGSLFSSVNYQKNNTELVMLVTPQLVEPLDPQQVTPPPGAEMGHPDDFQLFAMGQLEGDPRPAPEIVGVPRESAPVNTPPETSGSWPTTQLTFRGPWGLADYEEN